MSETLCARCQNAIASSDGSLMFCPHCGAPQVFLPEPMREQAAEQARQFAEAQHPARVEVAEDGPEGAHHPPVRPAYAADPGAIAWPVAVRAAGITGLIAAALDLGSAILAPVVLLAMIWAMLAPVFAIRLYRAKAPGSSMTPRFGARLGLIAALFVATVTAAVYAGGLMMVRYVFHAAGPLDTEMQARWSQMLVDKTAPGVDQIAYMLHIPEFRVGFILVGTATTGAIYLLVTSLIGWLAGQSRPGAATRS